MIPPVSVAQTVVPYSSSETSGVTFITVAGLTSLLAVAYLLIFRLPSRKTFKHTHMFGYFMCLMAANIIQALGTVMNFKWLSQLHVETGGFCTAQGAIKQAGNVASSAWTLIIAYHVFNLLFLRVKTNKAVFITAVCGVWSFVLIIILVGLFGIRNAARDPFYGIVGTWCWITENYYNERILLEYFFSFIAVFFSAVLYTAVLLRVRGNLTKNSDQKWRFQFVSPGNEWKLSITRDIIDNSMVRVIRMMVWYPITYTIILFPVTVTIFMELSGDKVPFWATAVSSVFFELNGFVNVILVIFLERHFPDGDTLPEFTAPREKFRQSFVQKGGVLPFTMTHSEAQKKYQEERAQVFTVTLPTKPSNAYVAPKEWQ